MKTERNLKCDFLKINAKHKKTHDMERNKNAYYACKNISSLRIVPVLRKERIKSLFFGELFHELSSVAPEVPIRS
jgi:hypothetical protein